MSLFQSLRQLFSQKGFPLEDFHTEIVAKVLENDPTLVMEWLRAIGATNMDCEGTRVNVRSQVQFPALSHHPKSSRIDLTIRLSHSAGDELIFIESKVGAAEGVDQLQRYADHLAIASNEMSVSRATLIYVTRNFESVTPPTFSNAPLCRFLTPSRWFIFYSHLSKHAQKDALETELKLFMEEQNMSLGNRFRPADILTLQNLLHTKSLMDETLESVRARASEVVGVRAKNRSRSIKEIQECWRYCWLFALGNGWDLVCNVGYWFSDENDDDCPWVGIELQSNPGSPRKDEIRKALISLAVPPWDEPDPADPDNWWGVCIGKPLRLLLSEDDQVEAVKQLLLSGFDCIAEFRKSNPSLPWGADSTVEDPAEEED